jgi:hypothetical protein
MKSKAWNYLAPIISGVIGIIIGGLVDWKKEDSLATKEFEYRLIESSLSQDIKNSEEKLTFLLDIGLISAIDTAALQERIKNNDLPGRGYWDGFVLGDLSRLLRIFNNNKKRFPKDIDEFSNTYPITLHKQIIGTENLRYQGIGNKLQSCKLEFAGPDNVWGTSDDKAYSTNDILGR